MPKRLNSDALVKQIIEDDIEDDIEDEDSPLDIGTWCQSDFVSLVKKRESGTKKDLFYHDIRSWTEILNAIPTYDESKIRSEIKEWDMDFSTKDLFDFSVLQDTYSRMNSYRWRICELVDTVNRHYQTYNAAYKMMEKVVYCLFTSGTIPDRNANSANMIQDLSFGIIPSKQLLDYLNDIKSFLEFSAMNITRLLKEKEILIKTSTRYESGDYTTPTEASTGDYINYKTDEGTADPSTRPAFEIPTRRTYMRSNV